MAAQYPTRNFAYDQRGAIAIFAALTLPIMVGCAALAVDLASIYLERRTAQGVVDLAAINAAAYPDISEQAAQATLAANNIKNFNSLVVTKGHYDPDPTVPATQRFHAGVEPYNAVNVVLVKEARMFFAKALQSKSPVLKVAATAGMANSATFSVGTRLAAVRGGMANDILSALVGTRVDLSVMDYNALVDANVRIDSAMNGVAKNLNLTAVTYQDVLKTNLPVTSLATALQSVLQSSGNSSAASALASLASQTRNSSAKVQLQKLIDLGNYGSLRVGNTYPGLGATVSVLDMIRGAAFLANGSKQVSINLQLNIPGVAKSTLTLGIGEPMQYSAWASVGQPGSAVRTAQLKFRLTTELGGTGALSGITIRLPIYAEAAYADARLADVTCVSGPENANATIATTPGVARLAIADVSDAMLSSPTLWQNLPVAQIVTAPFASVTGSSEVVVGNTSPTNLNFTSSDVSAMTIKRAETSSFLSSIASSLIGKLSLQVQVLGLGISLPGISDVDSGGATANHRSSAR